MKNRSVIRFQDLYRRNSTPFADRTRWFAAVCCRAAMTATAAIAILLFAAQSAATVGEDGWTKLFPSSDSRIIYVSNSQGDNNNNGLSPQTPVKTISKGLSLLRNNHPDWVLLRRGDTFTNEVINTGWTLSGRSAQEPMVIGSYGSSSQRPKILSPSTTTALQTVNGHPKHVYFVGLHLEPHNRQPNQGPRGVRWLASATNILFEDCYIGGYRDNITFETWQGSVASNVRIRRSVIVDAWSTSSHAQGIYAEHVDGLLIEDSVFDHNGWNPSISGAGATIYNHNMYIQRNCKNVTIRGNVIARAASTGLQLRPGGVCENNLALRNPLNLLFGQFQSSWPSEAASGVLRNNVVFDSRDINASNPRGFGIWLQKVKGVEVYGNIVARHESGTNNIIGFFADYNYENVTLRDNVVYDWKGGRAIQWGGTPGGTIVVRDNVFQQPNNSNLLLHNVSLNPFTYKSNKYHSNSGTPFQPGSTFNGWVSTSGETGATWSQMAPTNSCTQAAADLYAYMQCIGFTPTFEAFLAEARKQSRTNWRPKFTAAEVNTFVRTSYGHPAAGH